MVLSQCTHWLCHVSQRIVCIDELKETTVSKKSLPFEEQRRSLARRYKQLLEFEILRNNLKPVIVNHGFICFLHFFYLCCHSWVPRWVLYLGAAKIAILLEIHLSTFPKMRNKISSLRQNVSKSTFFGKKLPENEHDFDKNCK